MSPEEKSHKICPSIHFHQKKFSVVGGWVGGVGWGGCKSDFNVCSRPFDWSKSIFNVSSTLLPDDLTWDRVRGLALDNIKVL